MVGGRMKSRENAKKSPQFKEALNIVGILGLADSLTHVTPEFLGSKQQETKHTAPTTTTVTAGAAHITTTT